MEPTYQTALNHYQLSDFSSSWKHQIVQPYFRKLGHIEQRFCSSKLPRPSGRGVGEYLPALRNKELICLIGVKKD
jgi:hypothetical protein